MSGVGSSTSQIKVDAVRSSEQVKQPTTRSATPEVNQENTTVASPKDQVTQQDVKKGTVPSNIQFYDVVKKPVAGTLIGVGGVGSITALSSAVRHEEGLKSLITIGPKPHFSSTLSAGMIGLGIGVLNLDTHGDKKTENIKNMTGGSILGSGVMGMASSIARVNFSNGYGFKGIKSSASSPAMMGYGAAAGLGFALVNTDASDKNIRVSKNAVGGALIGTGAAGVAAAAIRSLAGDAFLSAPATVVALGAIAGAGIAIAATDDK